MITFRGMMAVLVSTMLVMTSVSATDSATTGEVTMSQIFDTGSDCLAGIAGVVRQEVKWFNGQSLLEYTVKSDKVWVYAMEAQDDDGQLTLEKVDPTEEQLIYTGREWTFADPNGAAPADPDDNRELHYWTVKEYKVRALGIGQDGGPDASGPEVDPVNDGPSDYRDHGTDTANATKDTVLGADAGDDANEFQYRTVYAVQIYAGLIDERTVHENGNATNEGLMGAQYNWVMIVDTCTFRGASDGQNANGNLTYEVELFVGSAPNVCSTDCPQVGEP